MRKLRLREVMIHSWERQNQNSNLRWVKSQHPHYFQSAAPALMVGAQKMYAWHRMDNLLIGNRTLSFSRNMLANDYSSQPLLQ